MFLNQNPWHSKIFFSFLEDSSGLVLASPFRGFFVGIFWASLQKFGQTTKTQSAVAELGEEQQSNFCLEEWWYLVSAGWVSPAPSSAFVFKETKFWLIVFRSAKRVWLEGLEKKGRKNPSKSINHWRWCQSFQSSCSSSEQTFFSLPLPSLMLKMQIFPLPSTCPPKSHWAAGVSSEKLKFAQGTWSFWLFFEPFLRVFVL